MYGHYDEEIGQLYPAERTALHEMVLKTKPNLCVEIGTWKGAGSTLQIVSALTINHKGVLHTCETNTDFYDIATRYYSSGDQKFMPRLVLHNKPSLALIQELTESKAQVDFLFTDGSEDPDLAVEEFKTIEPLMTPGSIFAAHDWLNEKSTKAIKLRKVFERNPKWTLLKVLTPPASVGLAFYKMTG